MDCVLFLFGVSDIWKNFCEKSEKMSARKYREKMSRKMSQFALVRIVHIC